MTSAPHLTPEQKKFLNRYTIGKWGLNPKTGLVDVEGDFDCSRRDLESLRGIRFGNVSGGFYCYGNHLTTLEGAPESVGGSFTCHNNQLTSLEGAPQSVGKSFYCSYNQLVSLEGAPESVGGNFTCHGNQLTSLKGAPESVGGGFDCSNNQLTSLKGAPQSVSGYFGCSNNQLTSLEGAPESVGDDFYCSNNLLTSLRGAPESVGRGFNCDAFQLDAGEWNVQGWLKAAQVSEEATKLLVPLLPEQELDVWMRKHPLDLDLLNAFPEIKSGVLKRTGIRDVSKLAAARRQGMV